MNSFLFIAILSLIIFSTSAVYGNEEFTLTSRPTSQTFSEGEFPAIIGVIKDSQNKPLENVKVSTSMFSRDLSTTTNNVGSFILKSPVSAKPGSYTVNVVAVSDGKIQIKNVSFTVNPNNPIGIDVTSEFISAIETIPKSIESIPSVVEHGITNNPVSDVILQQMESQRKFLEQKDEKFAYFQFLEEQRRLAGESLEKDILTFNKEYDIHSPRKAFANFVSGVDVAVQDIFWGQFNLTEKLSNDAHNAKLQAIADGQTPEQAMKSFQRKAAITHQELIKHNEELNVKYGSAQRDIQNTFDENGKLPRE